MRCHLASQDNALSRHQPPVSETELEGAMTTVGLSAYELDRLATIRANNQYLASLNLGPSPLLKDATNKAPRPTKKKSLRKPKRKPVPIRSSSGRAAEVQARTEQERREAQERAAQDLAEREARAAAQRAARERSQREARRQAVETARLQEALKKQRDAERAALLVLRRLAAEEEAEERREAQRQAQCERLAQAQAQAAAAAASRRAEGAARAARRQAVAQQQHSAERRRLSLRRASEATVAPARPFSSGRCGTPGCMQALNHLGPCSTEVLSGSRRSAARAPRQYDEADDSESDDEADLIPVALPLQQRTAAVHAVQARLQKGWRADGHRFLGRRAVRLFRRQPVLGTLVAWLPPEAPKQPTAAADDDDDDDDGAGAPPRAPPRAPPSPPALRRSGRAVAPPSEFWRATGGPSEPPPRRRPASPPRPTRRGPLLVGEDATNPNPNPDPNPDPNPKP